MRPRHAFLTSWEATDKEIWRLREEELLKVNLWLARYRFKSESRNSSSRIHSIWVGDVHQTNLSGRILTKGGHQTRPPPNESTPSSAIEAERRRPPDKPPPRESRSSALLDMGRRRPPDKPPPNESPPSSARAAHSAHLTRSLLNCRPRFRAIWNPIESLLPSLLCHYLWLRIIHRNVFVDSGRVVILISLYMSTYCLTGKATTLYRNHYRSRV
jgi:hypothetical protein